MTICHFLPSKRHCLQTASLCEFSISTKLIICFSLNILIVDIYSLFNIWDILLSCVCLLFMLVLRFAVFIGVKKLLKATYLLTYFGLLHYADNNAVYLSADETLSVQINHKNCNI